VRGLHYAGLAAASWLPQQGNAVSATLPKIRFRKECRNDLGHPHQTVSHSLGTTLIRGA
jgi:hypothetical protein